MTLCYSMIMKLSEYQKKKIEDQQKKAMKLYKQGLTTREVGKALGKSHTWAWNSVRKMSTVGSIDKS